MSDLNIVGSNNPAPSEPSAYITPFVASTLPVGTPVYQVAGADDTVDAAEGNVGGAKAFCVGLLAQPSTAGQRGLVKQRGPITLTLAQWDAIAGTSGLTRGDAYYVSTTVAGKIVNAASATASVYVVFLGVALDATTLSIGALPALPTINPAG